MNAALWDMEASDVLACVVASDKHVNILGNSTTAWEGIETMILNGSKVLHLHSEKPLQVWEIVDAAEWRKAHLVPRNRTKTWSRNCGPQSKAKASMAKN
jgi:hypothetical protein